MSERADFPVRFIITGDYMNSGIMILCKDKFFSRMLEIELKTAGCFVVSGDNVTEGAAVVYINDADGKMIEITSTVNDDKRIFSRPFYIKDAVNYISALLGGYKESPPPIVYAEIADREAYYDLQIDDDAHYVTFRGEEISLTKREYDLLAYLYAHKGTPISRDEAVTNVWKYDFTGDTNIVDVYIRYLREKLDDKYNTKLIYTVRHKGYMIK